VNRTVKRAIGGFIALIGLGLSIAFILSEAWFGVLLGLFIGLLGAVALVSPDDVFRTEAKEVPVRGVGRPTDDGEP
jgi:hypothetical protein